MRILCYKNELSFPRTTGHDIPMYHFMQQFARMGATVAFAVRAMPSTRAIEGLDLAWVRTLGDADVVPAPTSFNWLQERYRGYWGVNATDVARLGGLAREFRADAVIVSGLTALPMLGALEGMVRIWHASDEWALHHLSLMQLAKPDSWIEGWHAGIKGLYERAYGSRLERAWVVTKPDATAMRLATGVRHVDILSSGVDLDEFTPVPGVAEPRTAIFWGRLDFIPNMQAMEWFFESGAWTTLRREFPEATFTIMGMNPGPGIVALANRPGVRLLADVPDIRPIIAAHSVVVLPMVTGAGIKNKLLEAAAMAKPIVCTRRATLGLQGAPPVDVASTGEDFAKAIAALWKSPAMGEARGQAALAWVRDAHSWRTAAAQALAAISESVAEGGGRAPSGRVA